MNLSLKSAAGNDRQKDEITEVPALTLWALNLNEVEKSENGVRPPEDFNRALSSHASESRFE